MKYAIKRGNTVIAEVHAEGQVTERIMGEQLVDATFSLPNKVQFQLWDSIAVDGKTYYLHATPTEEKISSRNFRYTLQFAGVKYFLANELCFFPDKDNKLTLSEFSITGTAEQMLSLIVQNANREQSGWAVGNIATSKTKQVDFDGHSCLSALAKVAEAFDIEYWVDADKSIHLEERKQVSGYAFEYGIHKGLKGITRLPVEGANIVTRLYAEGGEKNLRAGYRNYKKRLQIPVAYLEKNTDKYGVIEAIQRFDDIYPHRTGTVTAVNADNPLQFTDANMPFDLNAVDDKGNTTILIDKVSAKVTFNTGQLAGYAFEIKEHGYKHETKTFELLKNTDEKDLQVPSEALRPAVGDTYVITDIIMPQSYITAAEVELQAKAQEYLDKNCEQRNVYEVVADPVYFAEQNVNVQLGHTCLFKDADFGLNDNLRVLGTVKNLQNLKDVRFELGDTATVVKIIREYFKVEKKATELRKYLRYNADTAKRSYQFAREIADNVFDNEGYFDAKKIKPLSIDTKLLTVGSRSQQFNLVDIVLTVEQNNTAVRNTAGQIIHLTIEDTPRTWEIAANVQTGIGTGFHYVYVKAQRVGGNANILVSTERIILEQDETYWHFEAGYLGSVQNGFRRIKTLYGFTQVSPGEITTGRIAPPEGSNYIELLQDRINIKGNVTFTAGSPALADVKNISNSDKLNAIAEAKKLINKSEVSSKAAWEAYATAKANNASTAAIAAAKAYATAEDAKKEALLKVYADGKVTDLESRQLAVINAKATLAKTQAQAYADNKITAEEAKRIAADEAKLAEAEAKARELVDNIKIGGVNLFDNKERVFSSGNEYVGVGIANIVKENLGKEMSVSAEVKVSPAGQIMFYSLGGYSVGFNENFQLPADEWVRISATGVFTKKDEKDYCNLSFYGIYGTGRKIEVRKIQIEEGNKSTSFAFSTEDLAAKRDKKIAEAKAASKTAWEAYATAKANNASAAAIAAAKAYATAEDAKKEALIKAYADGKVTDLESRQLAVIKAKAALAKTQAQAYADNKITTEEAKRIAADEAKLAEAEAKARELVDAVEVGGRNLFLNSKKIKKELDATYPSYNQYWGVNIMRPALSEFIEPGDFITISFDVKMEVGTVLRVYDSNNSSNFRIGEYEFNEIGNKKQRLFFTKKVVVGKNQSIHTLSFYNKNNGDKFTISKIKIEKGTKATDWTPAPEDLAAERDKKIAEAKNALEAQLAAAKAQLNAQLNAAKAQLNAGIDEIGKKTNFLEKSIVDPSHAVIGTGALLLGNENGANTCLTGIDGNNPNAVTISSGSTYANRGSAPFRVTAGGDVYSERSFIKGHIIAHSGSFKGYMSAPFLVVSEVYNNMELDLSTNLNIILNVKDSLNVNLPNDRKYNGATSVIVHNSIGRTPMTLTVNNTYYANYALLMFLAVPTEGSEVTWVKIYEQHLPAFNAS